MFRHRKSNVVNYLREVIRTCPKPNERLRRQERYHLRYHFFAEYGRRPRLAAAASMQCAIGPVVVRSDMKAVRGQTFRCRHQDGDRVRHDVFVGHLEGAHLGTAAGCSVWSCLL